jgi:hypothetical protein
MITNGTERSDENDMHHNSDVLQEDYDSLASDLLFSIGGPSESIFVPPEATAEKDLSAIIWPSVWICGIVLVVSLVEMDIVFHLSRLAFYKLFFETFT